MKLARGAGQQSEKDLIRGIWKGQCLSIIYVDVVGQDG